jgi:hypothetical protein
MKILVLGAPFSGLRCMFNMLKLAGYDVGFEKPGKDGMVRTTLFADEFYINGYARVYHIVSNPLLAIPALSKFLKRKEHQLFMTVDDWVKTNNRLRSLSDETARIENIKNDWPSEMFRPKKFSKFAIGIKPMPISKLQEMGDLGMAAVKLATSYGYEL